MAFDPDAYLAKKQGATAAPSSGFDPDAYLAKKGVAPEEKGFIDQAMDYLPSPRGLLKGTLESLPTAGALAGGTVGAIAGIPALGAGAIGGGVIGSGLGASAGKALQNLGEKYLLDEEKSREDIYGGPVKAGVEGLTAEMGGQAIAPAAQLVGQGIKKVVSGASRIPEKTISTFLNKGKDVEGLISKYGADSKQSADALRQEINQNVQTVKNVQNSKISKALEERTDLIDMNPTIDILNKAKDKLDPVIDAAKIAQIDDKLTLLSKISDETGHAPIARANSLKQNLQEAADYLEPGQFFRKKGLVDVAMEKAAATTNQGITKAAPEIREANKTLQQIRRSTKNMNRNLLKEGQTENSIIQAAQGTDRNADALQQLGALTGKNYLGQAENIAAQKTFAEPGLLPGYNTGAATIPLLLGGGYAGKEALEGDYEGAAKGLLLGAMGSPLALKYAIQGARPLLRGGRAIMPLLREVPKGLINGK